MTGETLVKDKTLEELATCSIIDNVNTQKTVESDQDERSQDDGSPRKPQRFEPHLIGGE